MYPEKPKNKNKNQPPSRKSVIIAISLFIIGLVLGTLVYIYPKLFTTRIDLSNVESITIKNGWVGLSPLSPVQANYTLIMDDGDLVGDVIFSIMAEPITERAEIEIPVDDVNEFIKLLESVELIEGDYHPLIEWTDDYPYITMTFRTDHGDVIIYTSSQGEFHVPWGATINNKSYIINSEIPMQALDNLDLKRNIQDQMIADYRNSK